MRFINTHVRLLNLNTAFMGCQNDLKKKNVFLNEKNHVNIGKL